MATPSQIMSRLINLRRRERDRRLNINPELPFGSRRAGPISRRIDRWSAALERKLLGIIVANQGGTIGVMGAVDAVLLASINDQAEAVDRGLQEFWRWAYESAVRAIVISVPLGVWVARQMPILRQPGKIGELDLLPESVTEAVLAPGSLKAEDAYQRIIDGKVDRNRAMEIIADTEFPPPSIERVREVLDATSADDGLSAINRIKTIEPQFRSELRQTILTAITDPDRASAVEGLAKKLRTLVGNDPGKTTGMNYRAKRIARTEGVRIAEDALRDSWERVPDMVTGIQYFNAHVLNSRQTHIANEGKYTKQPNGDYIRKRDGRVFPTIPAGANCLCWSSPIFRFDVDRTIPPANLQRFKQAQARSKAEIAAIKAKKGKRKPKPKPDLPLRAKPTPRKKAAVTPKRKLVTPRKKKPTVTKPKVEPVAKPLTSTQAESGFKRAEAQIADGKNETVVVFDSNGNELFRKTGGKDSVEFTAAEAKKMRGGTLTHNHPSQVSTKGNGRMENIPLSGADGAVVSGNELKEIRAVTENFRYSLKPKKGVKLANPEKIQKQWKARERKLHRKEVARLSEEVRKGKITPKQAARRSFQSQSESQHQAWEEVSDSLGLEYRRIRRG